MIILDTCVIYGMSLTGAEAALLRALRETGTERVAVPWMVREERVAQLALKYEAAHEKALTALKQLKRETPGAVPDLGAPDLEAVRAHWRDKLAELVEVLPTSEAALRGGMYREANILPPANSMPHPTRQRRVLKLGARDASIWLSAVEYARDHPEETVYFVSSNTSDFTDGSGKYPAPMDKDVEGLGERFVHLKRLDEVLKLVAPSVEVTSEQVESQLPAYADHFRDAALAQWGMPTSPATARFPARAATSGAVGEASCWLGARDTVKVKAVEVSEVRGYRLSDDEWCTATVLWQVTGAAFFADAVTTVACTWRTRILLPLVEDGPAPRILSADRPTAPADDASIDWPPANDADVRLADIRRVVEAVQGGTRWEKVLASLWAMSTGLSFDDAARRRFIETERENKIRMDIEADAATAEDWTAGDDLWSGLDD
ncbi:PIN domain-containing protein [Streptomyces sp. NBC_00247]|uniref:PIN domain-containing protein n=1 Tax=Streptomyces sp. NBC_00247 TaxID=2975689 RepID=UPI002E2A7B89|nr:PIN domain-containing protein [Streptomyces sp. NBC_00247]